MSEIKISAEQEEILKQTRISLERMLRAVEVVEQTNDLAERYLALVLLGSQAGLVSKSTLRAADVAYADFSKELHSQGAGVGDAAYEDAMNGAARSVGAKLNPEL